MEELVEKKTKTGKLRAALKLLLSHIGWNQLRVARCGLALAASVDFEPGHPRLVAYAIKCYGAISNTKVPCEDPFNTLRAKCAATLQNKMAEATKYMYASTSNSFAAASVKVSSPTVATVNRLTWNECQATVGTWNDLGELPSGLSFPDLAGFARTWHPGG